VEAHRNPTMNDLASRSVRNIKLRPATKVKS
jgi:hypothetical protein